MNLSLNTPVHLSVFANLMHGLPKLRTIIAQVSLDNYAEEDDPDMSAVTEMEWECFCLVDFSVGFHLKSSSDNIPLAEWGKSKVESSLSYIFSQVAQLQSLNTLKMTCGIALLTVDTKSGYLSRLSQLKKLKQLHFEETQCALGSVGSLEAEWMIKNWPWLSQVGYFTQDQVMDRGGPFLTTLVNNRPWIQIAPLLLE
ncbi:hypothetical protein BGX26_009710 [Mortierella sp. AD094]|nr:hypothetical protein BGX26_009710 [Mortierella sp. AD094]